MNNMLVLWALVELSHRVVYGAVYGRGSAHQWAVELDSIDGANLTLQDYLYLRSVNQSAAFSDSFSIEFWFKAEPRSADPRSIDHSDAPIVTNLAEWNTGQSPGFALHHCKPKCSKLSCEGSNGLCGYITDGSAVVSWTYEDVRTTAAFSISDTFWTHVVAAFSFGDFPSAAAGSTPDRGLRRIDVYINGSHALFVDAAARAGRLEEGGGGGGERVFVRSASAPATADVPLRADGGTTVGLMVGLPNTYYPFPLRASLEGVRVWVTDGTPLLCCGPKGGPVPHSSSATLAPWVLERRAYDDVAVLVKQGLLSWYPLDEGEGTVLYDVAAGAAAAAAVRGSRGAGGSSQVGYDEGVAHFGGKGGWVEGPEVLVITQTPSSSFTPSPTYTLSFSRSSSVSSTQSPTRSTSVTSTVTPASTVTLAPSRTLTPVPPPIPSSPPSPESFPSGSLPQYPQLIPSSPLPPPRYPAQGLITATPTTSPPSPCVSANTNAATAQFTWGSDAHAYTPLDTIDYITSEYIAWSAFATSLTPSPLDLESYCLAAAFSDDSLSSLPLPPSVPWRDVADAAECSMEVRWLPPQPEGASLLQGPSFSFNGSTDARGYAVQRAWNGSQLYTRSASGDEAAWAPYNTRAIEAGGATVVGVQCVPRDSPASSMSANTLTPTPSPRFEDSSNVTQSLSDAPLLEVLPSVRLHIHRRSAVTKQTDQATLVRSPHPPALPLARTPTPATRTPINSLPIPPPSTTQALPDSPSPRRCLDLLSVGHYAPQGTSSPSVVPPLPSFSPPPKNLEGGKRCVECNSGYRGPTCASADTLMAMVVTLPRNTSRRLLRHAADRGSALGSLARGVCGAVAVGVSREIEKAIVELIEDSSGTRGVPSRGGRWVVASKPLRVTVTTWRYATQPANTSTTGVGQDHTPTPTPVPLIRTLAVDANSTASPRPSSTPLTGIPTPSFMRTPSAPLRPSPLSDFTLRIVTPLPISPAESSMTPSAGPLGLPTVTPLLLAPRNHPPQPIPLTVQPLDATRHPYEEPIMHRVVVLGGGVAQLVVDIDTTIAGSDAVAVGAAGYTNVTLPSVRRAVGQASNVAIEVGLGAETLVGCVMDVPRVRWVVDTEISRTSSDSVQLPHDVLAEAQRRVLARVAESGSVAPPTRPTLFTPTAPEHAEAVSGAAGGAVASHTTTALPTFPSHTSSLTLPDVPSSTATATTPSPATSSQQRSRPALSAVCESLGAVLRTPAGMSTEEIQLHAFAAPSVAVAKDLWGWGGDRTRTSTPPSTETSDTIPPYPPLVPSLFTPTITADGAFASVATATPDSSTSTTPRARSSSNAFAAVVSDLLGYGDVHPLHLLGASQDASFGSLLSLPPPLHRGMMYSINLPSSANATIAERVLYLSACTTYTESSMFSAPSIDEPLKPPVGGGGGSRTGPLVVVCVSLLLLFVAAVAMGLVAASSQARDGAAAEAVYLHRVLELESSAINEDGTFNLGVWKSSPFCAVAAAVTPHGRAAIHDTLVSAGILMRAADRATARSRRLARQLPTTSTPYDSGSDDSPNSGSEGLLPCRDSVGSEGGERDHLTGTVESLDGTWTGPSCPSPRSGGGVVMWLVGHQATQATPATTLDAIVRRRSCVAATASRLSSTPTITYADPPLLHPLQHHPRSSFQGADGAATALHGRGVGGSVHPQVGSTVGSRKPVSATPMADASSQRKRPVFLRNALGAPLILPCLTQSAHINASVTLSTLASSVRASVGIVPSFCRMKTDGVKGVLGVATASSAVGRGFGNDTVDRKGGASNRRLQPHEMTTITDALPWWFAPHYSTLRRWFRPLRRAPPPTSQHASGTERVPTAVRAKEDSLVADIMGSGRHSNSQLETGGVSIGVTVKRRGVWGTEEVGFNEPPLVVPPSTATPPPPPPRSALSSYRMQTTDDSAVALTAAEPFSSPAPRGEGCRRVSLQPHTPSPPRTRRVSLRRLSYSPSRASSYPTWSTGCVWDTPSFAVGVSQISFCSDAQEATARDAATRVMGEADVAARRAESTIGDLIKPKGFHERGSFPRAYRPSPYLSPTAVSVAAQDAGGLTDPLMTPPLVAVGLMVEGDDAETVAGLLRVAAQPADRRSVPLSVSLPPIGHLPVADHHMIPLTGGWVATQSVAAAAACAGIFASRIRPSRLPPSLSTTFGASFPSPGESFYHALLSPPSSTAFGSGTFDLSNGAFKMGDSIRAGRRLGRSSRKAECDALGRVDAFVRRDVLAAVILKAVVEGGDLRLPYLRRTSWIEKPVGNSVSGAVGGMIAPGSADVDSDSSTAGNLSAHQSRFRFRDSDVAPRGEVAAIRHCANAVATLSAIALNTRAPVAPRSILPQPLCFDAQVPLNPSPPKAVRPLRAPAWMGGNAGVVTKHPPAPLAADEEALGMDTARLRLLGVTPTGVGGALRATTAAELRIAQSHTTAAIERARAKVAAKEQSNATAAASVDGVPFSVSFDSGDYVVKHGVVKPAVEVPQRLAVPFEARAWATAAASRDRVGASILLDSDLVAWSTAMRGSSASSTPYACVAGYVSEWVTTAMDGDAESVLYGFGWQAPLRPGSAVAKPERGEGLAPVGTLPSLQPPSGEDVDASMSPYGRRDSVVSDGTAATALRDSDLKGAGDGGWHPTEGIQIAVPGAGSWPLPSSPPQGQGGGADTPAAVASLTGSVKVPTLNDPPPRLPEHPPLAPAPPLPDDTGTPAAQGAIGDDGGSADVLRLTRMRVPPGASRPRVPWDASYVHVGSSIIDSDALQALAAAEDAAVDDGSENDGAPVVGAEQMVEDGIVDTAEEIFEESAAAEGAEAVGRRKAMQAALGDALPSSYDATLATTMKQLMGAVSLLEPDLGTDSAVYDVANSFQGTPARLQHGGSASGGGGGGSAVRSSRLEINTTAPGSQSRYDEWSIFHDHGTASSPAQLKSVSTPSTSPRRRALAPTPGGARSPQGSHLLSSTAQGHSPERGGRRGVELVPSATATNLGRRGGVPTGSQTVSHRRVGELSSTSVGTTARRPYVGKPASGGVSVSFHPSAERSRTVQDTPSRSFKEWATANTESLQQSLLDAAPPIPPPRADTVRREVEEAADAAARDVASKQSSAAALLARSLPSAAAPASLITLKQRFFASNREAAVTQVQLEARARASRQLMRTLAAPKCAILLTAIARAARSRALVYAIRILRICKRTGAAIVLQSSYRRHRRRADGRSEAQHLRREKAVTTIAAHWRGLTARRSYREARYGHHVTTVTSWLRARAASVDAARRHEGAAITRAAKVARTTAAGLARDAIVKEGEAWRRPLPPWAAGVAREEAIGRAAVLSDERTARFAATAPFLDVLDRQLDVDEALEKHMLTARVAEETVRSLSYSTSWRPSFSGSGGGTQRELQFHNPPVTPGPKVALRRYSGLSTAHASMASPSVQYRPVSESAAHSALAVNAAVSQRSPSSERYTAAAAFSLAPFDAQQQLPTFEPSGSGSGAPRKLQMPPPVSLPGFAASRGRAAVSNPPPRALNIRAEHYGGVKPAATPPASRIQRSGEEYAPVDAPPWPLRRKLDLDQGAFAHEQAAASALGFSGGGRWLSMSNGGAAADGGAKPSAQDLLAPHTGSLSEDLRVGRVKIETAQRLQRSGKDVPPRPRKPSDAHWSGFNA